MYLKKIKKQCTTYATLVMLGFISIGTTLEAAMGDVGKNGGVSIGNLQNKNFKEIVSELLRVATRYTLTLLVALTVFVFAYGLMKYMFKGQGSDTARSEGRQLMLWGVIGLFVMTSVWGLVAIFASVIGHTGIVIPQFK